jgi:hypothetical protein
MPIYDNSYTNSYIRITGCIVTYNLSKANGAGNSDEKEDEIYNVRDCYTNKKYIYWNAKAPNELEFSNKILEKGLGAGRYLIVINDNGTHTEYINNNNPEFTVSFDGNSMNIVEKKVWGLYEQVDGHTEKFANIVSDIDGIRHDVGRVETTSNSIKETVSKFDQKADAIISSVGSTTKEFVNDEHRNEAYDELISLATELGLLLSNITNVYLSDLIFDDEEKSKIQDLLKILKSKNINVNKAIDRIRLICKPGEFKTKLESTQNKLNTTHSELVTLLDRILELVGKIESNEIDLLTDKFVSYNASINDVKNAIDDAIIDTLGGTIEQSISTIEQTAKGILSKVEGKVDKDGLSTEVKSFVKQSSTEVAYAFNDYANDRVIISNNGIRINKGVVKTGAIVPDTDCRIVLDRRSDPDSALYDQNLDRNNCRSIDISTTGEDSIRLKHNSGTYVSVGESRIRFYIGGYSRAEVSSSGINVNGYARYTHENYANGNPMYSIGDYNNGNALICQYLSNGIRLRYNTIDSNGYAMLDLRGSTGSVGSTSDINFKENIKYLPEEKIETKIQTLSLRSASLKDTTAEDIIKFNPDTYVNKNITLEELYNFIKNEMSLCEYNYIDDDKNNLNVIAQEIADTKIGSLFTEKDEEGNLIFFVNQNYLSVIVGALQYEMRKSEDLETRVHQLYNEINKLKGE